MQGALGYYWLHGPCNKHFVTVSKGGAFSGKGSSADTKRSMSSVVETFYSRGKIKSIWMWGWPHFYYSLIQMFSITLANHPIFAIPLRRGFTFIWNTRATKSKRWKAIWLSLSSTTIYCQFGLQVNVKKTYGIHLLRTIAIAFWYACIMKCGEPWNEAGRTIHWPTYIGSNRTSCSTIYANP